MSIFARLGAALRPGSGLVSEWVAPAAATVAWVPADGRWFDPCPALRASDKEAVRPSRDRCLGPRARGV